MTQNFPCRQNNAICNLHRSIMHLPVLFLCPGCAREVGSICRSLAACEALWRHDFQSDRASGRVTLLLLHFVGWH